MHLCVAPPDGGPRLSATRRSILLAVLGACLIGGCHRPARATGLTFDSTITPQPAVVGPATVTLHVKDSSGRAVHGAHLRVEAQMAHPGMATLIAAMHESAEGSYQAGIELTMAGDWVLSIEGTLANGDIVQHHIDLPGVRPAGTPNGPR